MNVIYNWKKNKSTDLYFSNPQIKLNDDYLYFRERILYYMTLPGGLNLVVITQCQNQPLRFSMNQPTNQFQVKNVKYRSITLGIGNANLLQVARWRV